MSEEKSIAKKTHLGATSDYRRISWKMTADQDGEPEEDVIQFSKIMVQVSGEPAGARVEIFGTILPFTWDPISDYDAIPLCFLIPGIKSSEDRVMECMPRTIGGTELTKLKVGILFVR